MRFTQVDDNTPYLEWQDSQKLGKIPVRNFLVDFHGMDLSLSTF